MGRKLGKVINCQSPFTVLDFLQQDLTHDTSTTSLNNANHEPRVETHEPMEDISYSTHHRGGWGQAPPLGMLVYQPDIWYKGRNINILTAKSSWQIEASPLIAFPCFYVNNSIVMVTGILGDYPYRSLSLPTFPPSHLLKRQNVLLCLATN